jgi:hypothetical protein
MKYIILLIALLLVLLIPYSVFSQKVIEQLPALVQDGTYTVKEEVFIQSVDDEINQRHRFRKIRTLTLEKKQLEVNTDSLVRRLVLLETERDSLYTIINDELILANDTIKERVVYLDKTIAKIFTEYKALRRKNTKLKKKIFVSAVGNVILVAIIIIL